jgi:hypothetical protein
MRERVKGAVIEVIERCHPAIYAGDKKIADASAPDDPNYEVAAPNEIRINGQKLFVSSDHPVTVHDLELPSKGVVSVTLTLVAKRVSFSVEPIEDPVESAQAELASAEMWAAESAALCAARIADARDQLAAAYERKAVAIRG